ncbi:MAG: response regulator [Leptolyngbyaceae cyanobacterium SM2_5_2]|nr:response regulator [Leptolyngbyaceae cyanobacterium SM2_5_2]
MRALLRRPHLVDSPTLQWGALQLNANTGQVTIDDHHLSLSPKEYGLLELFLRHPQRIFSNTVLLERLWSLEEAPGEETIRTHIKRLRRKLKQAGADDMIENIYGMGYRLKSQPSSPAPDPVTTARTAAARSFERFKPTLNARLEALQQAADALKQGHLPPSLHKAALAAAHKFAGSLGLFGLTAGSQLAANLEEWLQTPNLAESQAFCGLVAQLQRLLNTPPQPPSSAWPYTPWLSSPSAAKDIRAAPSLTDPAPGRILAITDSSTCLGNLQHSLIGWGWEVIASTDLGTIWASLDAFLPDAILIDLAMVKLNPFELCQRLRQHEPWQARPILCLTPQQETIDSASIYRAGADDYLFTPWNTVELVSRLSHHCERYCQRQALTGSDGFTGLANRYRATIELELLLKLAHRHDQPLSLLLLRLIPQTGDPTERLTQHLLKTISHKLPDLLQSGDVIACWDRSEILIGLWNADWLTAQERLWPSLKLLLANSLLADQGHQTQIELLLGAATFPEHGPTLQGLYQTAANCLKPVYPLFKPYI